MGPEPCKGEVMPNKKSIIEEYMGGPELREAVEMEEMLLAAEENNVRLRAEVERLRAELKNANDLLVHYGYDCGSVPKRIDELCASIIDTTELVERLRKQLEAAKHVIMHRSVMAWGWHEGTNEYGYWWGRTYAGPTVDDVLRVVAEKGRSDGNRL